MPTAEIIKMTLPHTVGIDGGYGGIPEITPEMVSAALGYGKLSDVASLYCRVKYQLQHNLRSRLEWKVTVGHVLTWGSKENWVCGMGIIPKLSKVALDEMLTENICRQCKGTGKLLSGDTVDNCSTCHGTGHKRFSKRGIAKRLGVDKNHYLATWESRYNRTINVYYHSEDEILQALNKL